MFADSTKVEAGQFDPNRPETLESIPTIFDYDVEEVAKLMGVSVKALTTPSQTSGKTNEMSLLQEVCNKLVRRRVESSNGDTWLIANLVSEAKFDGKKLTLEVTRSQAARMLNYGLNNKSFGIIDAKLLLGFKSSYTKRIFEMLSRFKNSRDYKTTVGELCEMLGTSLDDFHNFAKFRRSVLDRPFEHIIKESNGVWTLKDEEEYPKGYFIDTGRGRKVTNDTRIVFKMKYNNPESNKKVRTFADDMIDLKGYVSGVEGHSISPELLSRVVTAATTVEAGNVDFNDVMYLVKVAGEKYNKEN